MKFYVVSIDQQLCPFSNIEVLVTGDVRTTQLFVGSRSIVDVAVEVE